MLHILTPCCRTVILHGSSVARLRLLGRPSTFGTGHRCWPPPAFLTERALCSPPTNQGNAQNQIMIVMSFLFKLGSAQYQPILVSWAVVGCPGGILKRLNLIYYFRQVLRGSREGPGRVCGGFERVFGMSWVFPGGSCSRLRTPWG